MDWSEIIKEFQQRTRLKAMTTGFRKESVNMAEVEQEMIRDRRIPPGYNMRMIMDEQEKAENRTKEKKKNKAKKGNDEESSSRLSKKPKLPEQQQNETSNVDTKVANALKAVNSNMETTTNKKEDHKMDTSSECEEISIDKERNTEPTTVDNLQKIPDVKTKTTNASDKVDPETPALDPFMVYGIEETFSFNKELSKIAKFSAKICGKFLKVFPDSEADLISIAEFLQSQKIGYYRKVVSDYPIRAVLKGLPYNCPASLIAESLQELSFNVISVNQMNSIRDGRLLPFYKVEIKRDSKAKEIFSLTRLCHHIITVEAVKTTKKALQCFNCSLFNHTASECNLPTICCKCSGSHRSKECDVVTKDNPEVKPTCPNCGLEHVSSFRGCKAFPLKPQFRKKSYAEAAKEDKKKDDQPQEGKTTKKNSDKKKQKATTALQAKHTEITSLQEDMKSISQLVTEIKAEFGINSFSEIKKLLSETLQNIRNCQTKEEKLFVFIENISSLQANTGAATQSVAPAPGSKDAT